MSPRSINDHDREKWVQSSPQLRAMRATSTLNKRDWIYANRDMIDNYIRQQLVSNVFTVLASQWEKDDG